MRSARLAPLLACLYLAAVTFVTAAVSAADQHVRTIGRGQIRFDGAGPERWAWRFRREHRLVQTLRRRLVHTRYLLLARPDVSEAINLAGATYGNTATLWRKARCESTLDPRSLNSSSGAAGLLQFLRSTWATTPYAAFDIYSPYANALAAGWMLAHGRDEWACR